MLSVDSSEELRCTFGRAENRGLLQTTCHSGCGAQMRAQGYQSRLTLTAWIMNETTNGAAAPFLAASSHSSDATLQRECSPNV